MAPAPRLILVVGGSGFVGSHLCPILRQNFPMATVELPQFDIRNAADTVAVIRDHRPDVCIHLAAVSTVSDVQHNEDEAWRTNLDGTLHIARAIRDYTPDCSLLFASSAEAYGGSFRDGQAVSEQAPLAPLSIYGATKAAADLALGAMAEQGLRVVRLRPFNHTGPGQRSALVVSAFAQRIARIKITQESPVISVGNLDARRDFLDVRDVCAAYVACIVRRDKLAPGTILNLASGVPRRIGDILHDMLSIANISAEIKVDPAFLRPTDLPLTHGDATKARTLIGWTPTIPWLDTIRSVLDDWCARIAAEEK